MRDILQEKKKKEEKTELEEETDESKSPRKGRMKICRTLNVDKLIAGKRIHNGIFHIKVVFVLSLPTPVFSTTPSIFFSTFISHI